MSHDDTDFIDYAISLRHQLLRHATPLYHHYAINMAIINAIIDADFLSLFY